MKLNLKASVYASMVELDNNLVSMRKSGNYSVIAPVGACCSLIKTEVVYPSANSIYRYNERITCNGILLGTTCYRDITVDGGNYTYRESIPTVTILPVCVQ